MERRLEREKIVATEQATEVFEAVKLASDNLLQKLTTVNESIKTVNAQALKKRDADMR